MQRLVLPLLLAFFSTGCVAAIGNRGYSERESGARGGGADQAGGDLAEARLELKLAELSAESARAEAESALQFAREDLEKARAALAAFANGERPQAVTESELGLAAAQNRLTDAEAELGELEAMYAGDDFAELTKELVLSRGRRALDMARRSLALATEKHQLLLQHELPWKGKELEREVRAGELAVAEAERALERAKLEAERDLTKARKSLEEAEKAASKKSN